MSRLDSVIATPDRVRVLIASQDSAVATYDVVRSLIDSAKYEANFNTEESVEYDYTKQKSLVEWIGNCYLLARKRLTPLTAPPPPVNQRDD
ncbi:hypothetical protein EVAR_95265_1 [Eumeta japonica]|uniref:Uncharacterized protein n=1 Tax=Eumeta variegata TaxID=151549 RepID=A0A4C1UJX3_EUMVA|nr:hypothetical protein EVAR_95265_1 [Eumeta japonica]